MNLDHLRYFQTAAQLEHYGRAAEALNISQPALNYAIGQLESELGTQLFERSGRNIRLTRYGRLFLESVNASLEQLNIGVRTLQEFGENGGIVLLGGIRKLASKLIPRLMRDFLQQEKDSLVRFEVHTESSFSSDLLKAVDKGRLDMAFVSNPGELQRFECLPFRYGSFAAVVPQGHPLSEKENVRPEECLPYPFVCFSKRSGLRESVDRIFAQMGGVPQIAYENEEDDVIAGMVAAGFGIAFLPDSHVLNAAGVKILPLVGIDTSRTAYLCRKRRALYSPAADRFFAFCREEFRKQPLTEGGK